MSGFVAMQRDSLDHHLIGDAERFRAWFWLVANACWKPAKVRLKGDTIELQRGELSFSVRFLADAWGWSKSRVDRFLSDLRDEGMISTRSKIGTADGHNAGQGQSIITICNYDKYQDKEERLRDNSGTLNGTTAGQQRDKEEQGNKGTSLEREAKASLVVSDDCQSVIDAWNKMAGKNDLSSIRSFSAKRRSACKARIREDGLESIMQAIEHIPKSSFLRGETGDWAGANITFLLRPDSVTKILEGNYDDRSNKRGEPADKRDGIAKALDRRTQQPAGPFERYDDRTIEGNCSPSVARLGTMR